jgi:hypothetical protein
MSQQKGIHCRFGMKSVIAEAHYDGSRNAVVQLRGMRRWILAAPNQCGNMYLLPMGHPSGRHSDVDWSKPDWAKFPKFEKLQVSPVCTNTVLFPLSRARQTVSIKCIPNITHHNTRNTQHATRNTPCRPTS